MRATRASSVSAVSCSARCSRVGDCGGDCVASCRRDASAAERRRRPVTVDDVLEADEVLAMESRFGTAFVTEILGVGGDGVAFSAATAPL